MNDKIDQHDLTAIVMFDCKYFMTFLINDRKHQKNAFCFLKKYLLIRNPEKKFLLAFCR